MAIYGLGTVQLGLPYGNKADQALMPLNSAFEILNEALVQSIGFFDTAIAYGESESRLGAFDLAKKAPTAVISTKIPAATSDIYVDEQRYFDWVNEHSKRSLSNLKLSRHTLLQFHQCDVAFLNHPAVIATFKKILSTQIADKIGISIYSMDQAIAAIQTNLVSSLQIPANLIDTRFLDSEFLGLVRQRGIQLIVRSAMLQGVLVSDAVLPPVKKHQQLSKLRELTEEAIRRSGHQFNIEEAAARFLFGNHGESLDVVLIGADSVETLRRNRRLIERGCEPLPENLLAELIWARQYASDNSLFNPATWSL